VPAIPPSLGTSLGIWHKVMGLQKGKEYLPSTSWVRGFLVKRGVEKTERLNEAGLGRLTRLLEARGS